MVFFCTFRKFNIANAVKDESIRKTKAFAIGLVDKPSFLIVLYDCAVFVEEFNKLADSNLLENQKGLD